MVEPHFNGTGELNVVRFGLSDSVSGAVSDYYGLLFDTVNEFIEKQRGTSGKTGGKAGRTGRRRPGNT